MVKKFTIMCMFIVITNTQLIFASYMGASLSVHSEDKEYKPVKGVEVELYKNDKLVSSGVSNDSGDVNFKNLSKGDYEIEITSLPADYQDFNSKYYITITNDKQDYELEEKLIEANYGTVLFHQTYGDGSPVIESEIIIYDQDGNIVDTLVTDENGDAESEPLQEGTYYVEEKNGETYLFYVGGGIQKFEYIINPELKENSGSSSEINQITSGNNEALDEEFSPQQNSVDDSAKKQQQVEDRNLESEGVLVDSSGKEILSASTADINDLSESPLLIFPEYSWSVSILVAALLLVFILIIKNRLMRKKNARY